MTTFAELLTNVYSLTNRSDLIAESTLAVQAAVLNVKLRYLDEYEQKRNEVAMFYDKHLNDIFDFITIVFN